MVSQGGGAPLPAEGLEAALRPFGHSRLLPRPAYVDQAVFDWEERHFFRGGWMCVARSEDVADVGDQRAESVGKAGAFLARAEDGRLRGFANACRHRGHELLPRGETRNLHIVVCPYHSWSYRLDGSLRKAPRFDEWDAFEPEENGLVELPTQEWHGLVFVDTSGSPTAGQALRRARDARRRARAGATTTSMTPAPGSAAGWRCAKGPRRCRSAGRAARARGGRRVPVRHGGEGIQRVAAARGRRPGQLTSEATGEPSVIF